MGALFEDVVLAPLEPLSSWRAFVSADGRAVSSDDGTTVEYLKSAVISDGAACRGVGIRLNCRSAVSVNDVEGMGEASLAVVMCLGSDPGARPSAGEVPLTALPPGDSSRSVDAAGISFPWAISLAGIAVIYQYCIALALLWDGYRWNEKGVLWSHRGYEGDRNLMRSTDIQLAVTKIGL